MIIQNNYFLYQMLLIVLSRELNFITVIIHYKLHTASNGAKGPVSGPLAPLLNHVVLQFIETLYGK